MQKLVEYQVWKIRKDYILPNWANLNVSHTPLEKNSVFIDCEDPFYNYYYDPDVASKIVDKTSTPFEEGDLLMVLDKAGSVGIKVWTMKNASLVGYKF